MGVEFVVFDPDSMPEKYEKNLKLFLVGKLAEIGPTGDRADAETSPMLGLYFAELRQMFPPDRGRLRPDQARLKRFPELSERLCGYRIGPDLIHMTFGQARAGVAGFWVRELAAEYGLGYWEVAGPGYRIEVAGKRVSPGGLCGWIMRLFSR